VGRRGALSAEQRRAILDREIAYYVRHGYRVVSRTDTAAQLVKPKRFSFLWALLWFLLAGGGLAVYLIYYAAKRDAQVYIEIEPSGKVRRTSR